MINGSLVVFAALFLLGVMIVIGFVELFIEAVAQSAASLGVSGFFLAVVLAGIDLENAVLGVTAAVVSLPDLALGTVFGESLFVLAVAVGMAGLFVPFRMSVPPVYLVMLVLAPLPAFVMSVGGTISRYEGALLLALFGPLLAYIYWHERRSTTVFLLSEEIGENVDLESASSSVESAADEAMNGGSITNGACIQSSDGATDKRWDFDLDLDLDDLVPDLEDRSGPFNLAIAVFAIVGLTLGSLLTVFSAERIFVTLGISGLAFGATVLSFIASIEELALTVEPVRRGKAHLAVGNIVGSTVFYMTANIGLIIVLHPTDTGAVMAVHWPFFAACLLVVTVMLARGRVTRAGGVVLAALYIGYWIANYAY
ncbi:sodium:calcium antiporter [Natronococcus wangiae]|uniref:sodium:calcium antiporter n=1 Tax=Natronococcus wangiae TaxID=3068275 RepID=UPI00273D02B1|nr:sodium:calcium antiporter [Natronococcus sp. AD5]